LLRQALCLFMLAMLLACDRSTPVPTEAPSRFLDYETKADLRLPFEGAWFVAWGGRTLAQNQHAISQDQRFAVDLLVLRPSLQPSPGLIAEWSAGKSHRSDGSRNEHYYCYGRPILAPGDGQVVDVKDGLPENKPGKFEANHPGNYLVIDHGRNEFSMMAHLKPGSIKVSVGERVVAGQQVAACGNSGRSSEPHLHYHLQNSPRWFDGEGLPAQFQAFEADGQLVQRGEPRRGQLVRGRRKEKGVK
jgi:murein DD-endopeptidase MepM/ murein hydrolase activator NlpD